MTVRKRRGVAVMAGRLRENRNRPARGNRYSRALSPQRLAYAALSFPRAFTTTPGLRRAVIPARLHHNAWPTPRCHSRALSPQRHTSGNRHSRGGGNPAYV